jgi:hypothetical protein
MNRSEYAANLYLSISHGARHVATSRMPKYPPHCRLRFVLALLGVALLKVATQW